MDTLTKTNIDVQKRVAGFNLYRNHVGEAIIMKLLQVSHQTLKMWMRQDEWETRRTAMLQIEAMPAWASDLLQLVALQSRKLSELQQQLADLGAAPATVAARAKPAAPDYRHLLLLCEDAQQQHRLLGVSDGAGGDMSAALRTYAQQATLCYYVQCVPLAAGQQVGQLALLQAVLESMGLQSDGSVADGVAAITEKLNALGTGLLIFDKVDCLSDKSIQLLSLLYDATEGRAGMVLAATHLAPHIDRLAHLNRPGFRELKRRIGSWHTVGLPTDDTL